VSSSLCGASNPWLNATKEELAQTESTLERNVAAEALLRRIEVDDSDFPANRTVKEYVRYKIFDPEKADHILRLSKNSRSVEGVNIEATNMKARLTQPDGSTKEFGAESIHERQVVRDSSADTFLHRVFGTEGYQEKEKFLAVGGALPGAIIEFQITTEEQYANLVTFRPIQILDIPTRTFEYFQQQNRNTDDYTFQFFALSGGDAEVKTDKARGRVTLTKKNLPALHDEPFSGASTYYATTLVSCYTRSHYITYKSSSKTRHFSPDLPWAPVATIENWLEIEHVTISSGVKKTAAEITQGATSEEEKARRIHDYVAQLYLRFVRSAQSRTFLISSADIVSMDEVINFEKKRPDKLTSSDFLWLAVSLYRAAGLNTEVVMVPNRRLVPFNRNTVSTAFLQSECVALKIGEKWHFSSPLGYPPLAFDELPWEYEGQGGLLALDNKQTFVEIPFPPAERSVVSNTGEFSLEANGTLHGRGKLVFTGHDAYLFRSLLFGLSSEKQLGFTRTIFRQQFRGGDIKVDDIANVEDPYKPIEVSYMIRWPGFAVAADKRLIFHPFVFRTHSVSPFSATARVNPVVFDFPHQEVDDVKITLPRGYELEVKNAPPSAPGKLLSYQVMLTFAPKIRLLHSERTLSSDLISVGAKDYSTLKKWYDEISTSDQHELVLVNYGKPAPGRSPDSSAP